MFELGQASGNCQPSEGDGRGCSPALGGLGGGRRLPTAATSLGWGQQEHQHRSGASQLHVLFSHPDLSEAARVVGTQESKTLAHSTTPCRTQQAKGQN